MLLVNGIVTVPPVQIVALAGLVIVGFGFTVTVTVCGVPAQPCGFDVGVTVYVTVCTTAVLLVIKLLNGLPVCAVVLSPVVPGLSAASHENVDVTLLVKGILTVLPLQIVAVVVLVMVGVGTTETITVCGFPIHPCGDDVGVTVYVTV